MTRRAGNFAVVGPTSSVEQLMDTEASPWLLSDSQRKALLINAVPILVAVPIDPAAQRQAQAGEDLTAAAYRLLAVPSGCIVTAARYASVWTRLRVRSAGRILPDVFDSVAETGPIADGAGRPLAIESLIVQIVPPDPPRHALRQLSWPGGQL